MQLLDRLKPQESKLIENTITKSFNGRYASDNNRIDMIKVDTVPLKIISRVSK